jgi:uncharacterized membrane protein YvbJ
MRNLAILMTVVLLLVIATFTGLGFTSSTNKCSKTALNMAINAGNKAQANACLEKVANLTPTERDNYREIISLL